MSVKLEKQAHHIPRVVPRLKLPELPWVLPRLCETPPSTITSPGQISYATAVKQVPTEREEQDRWPGPQHNRTQQA